MKDDIKLFKSPTEGNILVKLMNITFEPVASLGRILYSFSANAVEIDEPTFENYKKYYVCSNNICELVTESPALDITHNFSSMVLIINADGASQNTNQNWALHLESRLVQGGKIV